MSSLDARRAPARAIFSRQGDRDVLVCGHWLGPSKTVKSGKHAPSGTLRRCWKCRTGWPAEYVVTARMVRDAIAQEARAALNPEAPPA